MRPSTGSGVTPRISSLRAQRGNSKTSFFFLLICLCAFKVFPQGTADSYPSLEPLFMPEEVLLNPNNTTLTADEVFELSLLYSECPPDSSEGLRCTNQFEDIKAKVTSSSFMELGMEDRGRAILKFLYENYLTAYGLNQTRVNVALQTGVYNCVSSALLYMAAAKAAGLDVRGQKTPDHAFCSIYVPGSKAGQFKKIDVETTNPYGFNPGSRETIEHENVIKGYYVVPKTYYSNRREVRDALFAGLIAGNLCSAYIDNNDYNNALPLGTARYLAVINDNSQAAAEVRKEFDILAANFINLVTEDAQDFYNRLEWYRSFIDRWGMTSFLQNNMDNAINNLLVFCFEEKNYELAREGWEKYKTYVSPKRVSVMEEMLVDTLIAASTQGFSPEEELSFVSLELAKSENDSSGIFSSEASRKRMRLHLENIWLSILNTHMNNRDYKAGYDVSIKALEQLPNSSKIKAMQKSFYNNCIALIHNAFANQANSRNYEAARKILLEGLEQFPDDRTLNNDLSQLKKIID